MMEYFAIWEAMLFTSKFDDNSAPVISSYARPITLDSDAETQSLLQYSSKSGVCPSDADDSYDFTGNAKGNIIIAGYGKRNFW